MLKRQQMDQKTKTKMNQKVIRNMTDSMYDVEVAAVGVVGGGLSEPST